MANIIRKIKALFGFYDIGYEYSVDINDIKINPEWEKTKIGYKKWKTKLDYYRANGELQSKIILDRNTFELKDGYSSYKIAKMVGIDKVPVYFVD